MSATRIPVTHGQVAAREAIKASRAVAAEHRHRALYGPKPATTPARLPNVVRTPSPPAPAAADGSALENSPPPAQGANRGGRPAAEGTEFLITLPPRLDGQWWEIEGVGTLLPTEDAEHVQNLLETMYEHRAGMPWDC